MSAWRTLDGRPSRIIAHRGASGLLPEHTLPAYELALAQGADVIEPDLVASADGVLFCRHDLGLARSTDVARRPQFADRRRDRDGVSDWWVDGFTAAELDGLRAVQPWPQRDHALDGQYPLLRFDALLDWAGRQSPPAMLYPELKFPQVFQSRGIDAAELLCAALEQRGLAGEQAPVWLQCTDHEVLHSLQRRCGNRAFALVERDDPRLIDTAWLGKLSRWADGIAPDKAALWTPSGDDSGLVTRAHDCGLEVHAWTFRDDVANEPFGSIAEELDAAFELGVDALFCDFPATAIALRNAR